MTIEVKPKKKGWSHNNFKPICEVCGKNRSNHKNDNCAKARQKAGWLDDQEVAPDEPETV